MNLNKLERDYKDKRGQMDADDVTDYMVEVSATEVHELIEIAHSPKWAEIIADACRGKHSVDASENHSGAIRMAFAEIILAYLQNKFGDAEDLRVDAPTFNTPAWHQELRESFDRESA